MMKGIILSKIKIKIDDFTQASKNLLHSGEGAVCDLSNATPLSK